MIGIIGIEVKMSVLISIILIKEYHFLASRIESCHYVLLSENKI